MSHRFLCMHSFKLATCSCVKGKMCEKTMFITIYCGIYVILKVNSSNKWLWISCNFPIEWCNLYAVELCCYNSISQDILENSTLHLDDMFIASLVADLIKVGIVCNEEHVLFYSLFNGTYEISEYALCCMFATIYFHVWKKTSPMCMATDFFM